MKQIFYIDSNIPEGLRWLKYKGSRAPKDAPAGYKTPGEYYQIKLNYKKYFNHRIIFSIANNVNLTEFEIIDHIDRNTTNNNPNNLRIVTCSENNRNATKQPNATSKFIDVFWDKKDKRWKVQIQVNGQRKYVGQFTSEIDAAKAYNNYIIENNLTHFNLNKI